MPIPQATGLTTLVCGATTCIAAPTSCASTDGSFFTAAARALPLAPLAAERAAALAARSAARFAASSAFDGRPRLRPALPSAAASPLAGVASATALSATAPFSVGGVMPGTPLSVHCAAGVVGEAPGSCFRAASGPLAAVGASEPLALLAPSLPRAALMARVMARRILNLEIPSWSFRSYGTQRRIGEGGAMRGEPMLGEYLLPERCEQLSPTGGSNSRDAYSQKSAERRADGELTNKQRACCVRGSREPPESSLPQRTQTRTLPRQIQRK